MKKTDDSEIRLIDNNIYIDRFVDLHLSAFSGLLSGSIGRRFLRFYYRRIIKEGFIFAYFKGDIIIGFVSGIINEAHIYNLKYYFYAILGIITHIYNPEMLLSLYRHMLRIIKLPDVNIESELLSIVVDEKFRGQGAGKLLVEKLNGLMIKNKVAKYKVFTDMKYSTGHKLYAGMGFNLAREINLAGLTLRMYVKELT